MGILERIYFKGAGLATTLEARASKGAKNMNITVRKATEEDKAKLMNKPTWGCKVSEFDWYYDSEEICILTEGEVTVNFDGGSVSFGAGDYVEFPKGLSCVWKVTQPVKKHYEFR